MTWRQTEQEAMIKKIILKGVGSFDKMGVVMDDLQRVNIIYGSNGTGKTTTSRVLEYAYTKKGYELKTGMTIVKPWKFPTCEVVWEGKPVKVMVYNKDFRERNLQKHIPGTLAQGDDMTMEEAIGELGYSPVVELGGGIKVVMTLPNKGMSKVQEEIERAEKELTARLWQEVYLPHKKWKRLLKKYNKKGAFADRIRQIAKEKREGDLFWNVEQDYKEIDADNIWHYLLSKSEAMVERAETEIASLRKAANDCQQVFNKAVNDSGKKVEAGNSNKDMIPCMDKINRVLRSHGYTGFSIQPTAEDSHVFQIQREDGSYVKDTLSEGEATIISFLLFLQMVENDEQKKGDNGKKVVVIDDPISSLDYAAIELVSTLTNELIAKARKGEDGIEQVIVLTHNASYQKSLNVKLPRRNTHYWKLTKKNGVSQLTAYGNENPVRGEYSELWLLLKNEDDCDSRLELTMVMKRILSIYFLEYARMDRGVVMPLLEEFKEGSGKGERERYMKKFKSVFERFGQLAHYNMMMRKE